ncbi:MAG: hypothetical protein RL660_2502 [Bacteroidota bacterium]|jgi:hypothetical protein
MISTLMWLPNGGLKMFNFSTTHSELAGLLPQLPEILLPVTVGFHKNSGSPLS